MNDHRNPQCSGAIRHLTWAVLLLSGVGLQSCAPAPGPAGSRLRVYAADLTGGAKTCSVPQVTPASGQATEAAIKLDNDGGWCGLPVSQSGPKPYDAGLLTVRPAHGTVLIHQVGDTTRIDYTPDRGFTGTDGFTVKLLPGDATIHVSAAVAPPVT